MIFSKYNLLFEYENKKLLYNSFSNSFIELEQELYNRLKNFQLNKDIKIENQFSTDEIIKFKDISIIVENDNIALNQIKYDVLHKRFNPEYLVLTIIPTFDCNFNCIYCFEDKSNAMYMDELTSYHLIEFIKSFKYTKHISITWFGGEPLLAVDTIKFISEEVISYIGKENYSSNIITNGFNLNEKNFKELINVHINQFQITIDGTKETHNKRRPCINDNDSFTIITQNVKKCYEYVINNNLKNIDFIIRVNLDKENIDEFIQIGHYLHSKIGAINIRPAFVNDISDSCKNTACIMNQAEQTEFLLELFKKHGICVEDFYFPEYRYECGVRNMNNFVIGPNGDIYKCYEIAGNPEEVVGNIITKNLDENKIIRYLVDADPLDDSKCTNCFLFPRCGGGCPHKRLENKYLSKKNDVCLRNKYAIKQYLSNTYEMFSQNS
ncbi:MAG: radical SAM protein [Bacteroidota bacterium]